MNLCACATGTVHFPPGRQRFREPQVQRGIGATGEIPSSGPTVVTLDGTVALEESKGFGAVLSGTAPGFPPS
jgi:hypothetical protein